MNRINRNDVTEIACGISFDFSFTLLDKWGEIADSILYNNSYFSPQYFPKTNAYYTTERRLFNEELGHEFRLSANNMIYSHIIQKSFEKEFKEFSNRIINHLVPNIFEKFRLSTARIGIVYTCQVTDSSIKEFRSKYFKDEFSSITDFRFAKKEPTKEGLSKTNNSDYINKIYTSIPKDDSDNLISFDYQRHYNPHKGSISEKIINEVFEQSKTALDTEILSLGKHYE
ncbi:MAG: hypothetical protein II969_03955 [Anaerolineaceae bacterium]|nr:hypothetical protein [Anaerolineaceae bacterium]